MSVALVAFILGGVFGYALAALLFINAENLENKRLRMELEAERREREYWQEQALVLRKKVDGCGKKV